MLLLPLGTFALEPFGENAPSLLCNIADVSGNASKQTADNVNALGKSFQTAFLLVGLSLDDGTFVSVPAGVAVKRKLESGIG